MDGWMKPLAREIADCYEQRTDAAKALPQVMTQVLTEHQIKICDLRLWQQLQQAAEGQLNQVAGSKAS
ncbi:MAG: hypothetical protein KME03_04275 [Aphanocapsa lilacina HA4352-LM1]|jgi:hypothetical protein|nr:hypothetical protein [Aphanocapsa lilacina HA4352-LM1]